MEGGRKERKEGGKEREMKEGMLSNLSKINKYIKVNLTFHHFCFGHFC